MKTLICLALAALLAGCGQSGAMGTYAQDASGLTVTPGSGQQGTVRLQVRTDRIVRVTAAPSATAAPKSLMVIEAPAEAPAFHVHREAGDVVLETGALTARVSLTTGTVSFADKDGRPLLAEEAATGGSQQISRRFNPGTDEGFFGSGQHQNAQLDLNGEDVELAQHNMDIAVPFVVSTRNYGLLWDNNGITRIGNPRPYGLASRDLTILDAAGKAGGFTATYAIDGVKQLERVEKDINYQYIRDRFGWPKQLLTGRAPVPGSPPEMRPDQTVTWEGSLISGKTGQHKFQLYGSSYFKVWVEGRLVLDRWRQNWAAWYHNFEVTMTAGQPLKVRIEWIPDGGYIALLHNDPLPPAERHSLTFTSDTGRVVDYYFIAGANADEVIAGYRQLTGKAALLPRWAYGFWQSRQRYTTQQELLNVLAQYRSRRIPIDNMVLDWFYWREDQWGSHEFDRARFPDPKAMVDAVHARHAQLMISVWPKFYPGTANFKELDQAGFMYHGNLEAGARDWVGAGYTSSFYDPYSKPAREMYWRQVNQRLGVLGIDAWWLDATEPDLHSNLDLDAIKARIGPTAMGPAADFFNSYALMHAGGVHEGWRKDHADRRAFILTRSGFGGLQRHAAAVWSGDIASRWDDLYNQISAGVSLSYSGLPNWTYDIGGFANERRFSVPHPKPADLAEWRELNLRWFQMGAFAPLFRSHGEYPYRETFNLAPPGSEVFNSLVWYDRLRYRLLPYIYTLAADTYHRDGTILRGLSMDFPADITARAVRDQYLFGPAFLVAPVYQNGARSRAVYLPAGTGWYDFHSGALHEGGTSIMAAAPLARMPLFVRAGAIVPVGPEVQYAGEKPDSPQTLLVFTGADGRFDYYEDDGRTYGYERGEFARIPLRYEDATGTLTLGARTGSYSGMPVSREFRVRWIGRGAKPAADLDAAPDTVVQYRGELISVRRPAPVVARGF